MKFITVGCYKPDEEFREALTVADTPAEAEEECRREVAAQGLQGFVRFNTCEQVMAPEGYQDGPARFWKWLGGEDVT